MRKKVFALAALTCLFALLAGCGGYAGVWRCAYMDTESGRMTAGDMDNAGSELYIDLRSGGAGYMTADGETQRITWRPNGDESALLLTVNGEEEPFYLEGEALIWRMDGVTVTFLRENSDGYKQALASFSYGEAAGN